MPTSWDGLNRVSSSGTGRSDALPCLRFYLLLSWICYFWALASSVQSLALSSSPNTRYLGRTIIPTRRRCSVLIDMVIIASVLGLPLGGLIYFAWFCSQDVS